MGIGLGIAGCAAQCVWVSFLEDQCVRRMGWVSFTVVRVGSGSGFRPMCILQDYRLKLKLRFDIIERPID